MSERSSVTEVKAAELELETAFSISILCSFVFSIKNYKCFFFFLPPQPREAIMQGTQLLWILWSMTFIFCQVGSSIQKSLHSLVSGASLKNRQYCNY